MIDFAKIADNEHCVYVLWAVLNDRMYVKVGMSSYLCSRIIQVCNGVPFDMSGAIILKGINRYHVKEIESAMHKALLKRRTRGEWFLFESEAVGIEAIKALTWEMSLRHEMERVAVDVDAMKSFYRAECGTQKPQKRYRNARQEREDVLAKKHMSTVIARIERIVPGR